MLNKNRRGTFKITIDLIDELPEILMMVMSRCIVIRAEMMLQYNRIEYCAISPEFDIVPDAQITPEYRVEVTKDEAGAISIMFVLADKSPEPVVCPRCLAAFDPESDW